jgi:uncharacterized Zn-binding protein involved in type VI secretion
MGLITDLAEKATRRVAQTEASRERTDAAAPPAAPPRPPAEPGAEGASKDGAFVSAGKAVLGALGQGIAFATEVEQSVSPFLAQWGLGPLGLIAEAMGAMPAAAVGDLVTGIPHVHSHWPGVPLPHIGPILPIPYLSGAETVQIGGAPAGRCGDFFAQAWCGGFMPIGEVFTGSATVWIESARAARAGDITKHCTLADPGGPVPVGAIITGSDSVLIGGAPLPSLTALAMQGAMHVAGKAIGAGGKALKRAVFSKIGAGADDAERLLARFEAHAKIGGDEAFKKAAKEDLRKMAATKAGREQMKRILNAGKELHIEPFSNNPLAQWYDRANSKWVDLDGPAAVFHDTADAPFKYKWDPQGPYRDHSGGLMSIDKPGAGSGTTIYYDPGVPKGPGSPSDVVLTHEATHAANAAEGRVNQVAFKDPAETAAWKDAEEKYTVQVENAFRKERGLPQRGKYNVDPMP